MYSKNRKRAKKRRRQQRATGRLDTHHICYQRKDWKYGPLRELREYWYSKILIQKDTLHQQIHKKVELIPPPKPANARDVLCQLKELEKRGAIRNTDSLGERLRLYINLFGYIEPETANGFRRQLEIVRRLE